MSANSSLHHLLTYCFESRTAVINFTSLLFVALLVLLPMLVFILYLGLQRRRRQRSSTSTPAVISHSDFFTYNMAAMELINMVACGLYCFGGYNYGGRLQWVGYSIFSLTIPRQTLFHLLTCVERYLAVVHPITYLGLKQAGGVRIRNISSACVWLLCCGLVGLTQMMANILFVFTYFAIMAFFLLIICFCTFSILRVLKHPGPGQAGGERVDQSKQRAFHTVLAILVALLCRLVGLLACCVMFLSSPLTDTHCAVGSSAVWLAAPGSLVLPLLFLQRAGKLAGGGKRVKDINQT